VIKTRDKHAPLLIGIGFFVTATDTNPAITAGMQAAVLIQAMW
jgi:hypothetical protein